MNKHLKMAFMVAPFLAILGFVGTDYYEEAQANETKIIQLVPEGQCDVINKNCVLLSGEYKVNISHELGVTVVNSTFPLDSATIFLVDNNGKMSPYPLGMKKDPYYWRSITPLATLIPNNGGSYTLRLIAKIKGGQYISEFTTQTIK